MFISIICIMLYTLGFIYKGKCLLIHNRGGFEKKNIGNSSQKFRKTVESLIFSIC